MKHSYYIPVYKTNHVVAPLNVKMKIKSGQER